MQGLRQKVAGAETNCVAKSHKGGGTLMSFEFLSSFSLEVNYVLECTYLDKLCCLALG